MRPLQENANNYFYKTTLFTFSDFQITLVISEEGFCKEVVCHVIDHKGHFWNRWLMFLLITELYFFILIFSDSFQTGVSMVTNFAAVGIICNISLRDGHSSWFSMINHSAKALERSQLIVRNERHCMNSPHGSSVLVLLTELYDFQHKTVSPSLGFSGFG